MIAKQNAQRLEEEELGTTCQMISLYCAFYLCLCWRCVVNKCALIFEICTAGTVAIIPHLWADIPSSPLLPP